MFYFPALHNFLIPPKIFAHLLLKVKTLMGIPLRYKKTYNAVINLFLIPPTEVATTGNPHARASSTVFGNVSARAACT
jgi:hypothetical protein